MDQGGVGGLEATMGTSGRTVLAVGAGPEQVPTIEVARNLGLRVVAVDRDPAAPGMVLADVASAVDISDPEAVAAVARAEGVQAVVPAPIGRWLTTVGYVNDRLGLPGVSHASALACTDKQRFHERCVAAGARRPAQAAAAGRAQVLAAVAAVGLPCVLKPAAGSGSSAVVVVRQEAELARAVDWHLAGRPRGDHTLVEGLVAGQELGVDAAVVGGRLELVLLRAKELTPLPYRQQLNSTAPAPLPDRAVAAVTAELQTAVTALGLTDCLVNADVVLAPGDVATVLELAGRPAGARLADVVVPAVTGVAYLELGIRMVLGEPVVFRPRPLAAAVLRFFPVPAGRVVRVDPAPAAAASPDVLLFNCALRPGQLLGPMTCVADGFERGLVVARGADAAAARQLADEVIAGLDVEMDERADEREGALHR
jgi:biotin carboxylase